MRVTMAARSLDRLQALLAAEPLADVTPVAGDVTDEAAVPALFARGGAPGASPARPGVGPIRIESAVTSERGERQA